MLMAPAKLESMRKWIFLVVVLTVIDQITKRFAEAALEFAMPITAMPMLLLLCVFIYSIGYANWKLQKYYSALVLVLF